MAEIKPKAIIYCRVSDTKQKTEGSGLESQEFRCRQYAAQHGYDVEQVFQDDVSGGGDFAKRPGMTALLSYLELNSKDSAYVVLFDDLKRLSRDAEFHLQLRRIMRGFGVRVECLNYTFDDSPEGKFMETIFAAQGELEREQLGRQTRQKTQARMEAGFYAFSAPTGFTYQRVKGRGKMLVRVEPLASLVAEAIEGMASGRFQTKEETRRFLEAAPEVPKQASGRIGNDRINTMLGNPVYAGYVEYAPWGVSLRPGQHEGLVSYETFVRAQERMAERTSAPARKDLNKDFPLRGAISCSGCSTALSAGWSRSRNGTRHPYYVCQNRKCSYKGKSIRRAKLEGEFESLLKQLTPSKALLTIAEKMFRTLWDARSEIEERRRAALEKKLKSKEREIEQYLDRIVDATSPSVLRAFERRIAAAEKEAVLLTEQIADYGMPKRPFEQMYRTALGFLAEPAKLWEFGGFAEKRAVLKLAFTGRLIYDRETGYRTPDLSLPFRVLGGVMGDDRRMVGDAGIEPATPAV